MRNTDSPGEEGSFPPDSDTVRKRAAGNRGRRAAGRRRVRFIKRFIILMGFIVLMLPAVMCYFAVRSLNDSVIRLEEEISGLTAAIENLDTGSEGNYHGKKASMDGTYVGEPIRWSEKTLVEAQAGEKEEPERRDTRKVYLTFDDGPSRNTGRILDILDEYGVKASFFVVGKPQYSSLYKRITDEGHTIGMHSYSHRYGQLYASEDSFREDLEKIQNFIYDNTGVWSVYYRFPGGSSNSVSSVSMSDLMAFLNEQDIIYYDWNVSSGDAELTRLNSEQIVNRCITGVNRFPDQAVILFHDADDKNSTVEALPTIISTIQSMPDTEILPITEDTIPVRHRGVNGQNNDMEGL